MFNNHYTVHKKLIAKDPNTHSPFELAEYDYLYKDELKQILKLKKKQFLQCYKEVDKTMEETRINNVHRLQEDYHKQIQNADFLEEPNDKNDENDSCEFGKLTKKRTLRKAFEKSSLEHVTCSIEPWFKRYLVLNKFIKAARDTIITNRLLKVLRKLKTLTKEKVEELEKLNVTKCHNVSYGKLFKKFLK